MFRRRWYRLPYRRPVSLRQRAGGTVLRVRGILSVKKVVGGITLLGLVLLIVVLFQKGAVILPGLIRLLAGALLTVREKIWLFFISRSVPKGWKPFPFR